MKQFVGFIMAGVVGGFIVLGGIQMMPSNTATSNEVSFKAPSSSSVFASNPQRVNIPKTVPNDFIAAAEKGMPAVVHIKATQTESKKSDKKSEFDLFKDFFGGGPSFEGPRGGTGSGVIIKENGYIVTNNHVVDGADELEVTLYDNRKFKATLVGADPNTDLAVIKIEDFSLPTLEFANSDDVKVGEWVLAVGNPFNLTSTVTAGIVSAIGRSIDILQEQYRIESFIQTDAAVNPGNSGGALIDTDGKLVGINTAIASQTGSFAGYSFAIPVNIMDKIVNDLIEFGEPQRGFLGVSIQDMDNEIANDLGVDVVEGVHIIEVNSDGAAREAGLKPNDIIIGVDGTEIKNAPKLQELIGRGRPGDEVTLLIHRDGKDKKFEVILKK